MWNSLHNWLEPPVFAGDEIKTRQAYLLNLVLLAIFPIALALALLNLLSGTAPGLIFLILFSAALTLALLYWLRRGHVEACGLGTILFGMFLTTVGVYMLGTIRSPTTAVYLMVVLVAGFLFDWKGVLATVIASSCAIAALIWTENAGMMPPADFSVTATQWAFYTMLFGATGVLSLWGLNPTRQALMRTTQELQERKRAEQMRRSAEERFNTAFRSSPIGLNIFRLADARSVDVNDAFLNLIEYTHDEVIGHTAAELNLFLDPSQRARWEQTLHETGIVEPTETTVRTKTGEIRHALASMKKFELNGEPVVMTLCVDLSERKRIEEQLRASEAKYRALFENMQEGFALLETLTDASGQVTDFRFLDANAATQSQTGFAAQDIIGKTMREIDPQIDPRVLAVYGKVALTGESFSGEYYAPNTRQYFRVHAFCPQRGRFGVTFKDVTELKQAETALRTSARNLRAVLDATDESIFLVDSNSLLLDLNEIAAQRIGASRDKAIGRSIYDLMPASIIESRRPYLDRVLETGKSASFEEQRADTWIHHSVYPVLDDAGQVARLVIYSRDETERKRGEVYLRASEERFRTMFSEHAAVMLLIEPTSGVIVNANRAAAQFYGYSVETLCTMNIDAINTMSRAEIAQVLQQAELKQQNYFVFSHRRANGEIRTVEVHSSPLTLDDKPALFSIIHDITERALAEQALRASEIKYRIVADNTFDWEFWQAADGQFLYSSPSCARITGHTADEFLRDGQLLMEIIHPDDRAAFKRHKTHVSLRQVPDTVEFRIVMPDGSIRWLEHACQPVFDADEQYRGTRGSNRDVTEHKHLTIELENLAALVELTEVAIIARTFDDIITYWNRGAEVLYGWHRRSALGKNIHALLKTGFPKSQQAIRQTLLDGDYWSGELVHVCANGKPVTVASRQAMRHAPDGKPLAILEINVDITHRKRTEAQLRESEAKYRGFIEQSSDGLALVNAQGIIVEYNRAYAEITGIARADALGKTAWDIQAQLVPPDLRAQMTPETLRAHSIQMLEQAQRTMIEGRAQPIVTPSGAHKIVSQTLFAITGTQEPYVGIILRDLTERNPARN